MKCIFHITEISEIFFFIYFCIVLITIISLPVGMKTGSWHCFQEILSFSLLFADMQKAFTSKFQFQTMHNTFSTDKSISQRACLIRSIPPATQSNLSQTAIPTWHSDRLGNARNLHSLKKSIRKLFWYRKSQLMFVFIVEQRFNVRYMPFTAKLFHLCWSI